MKKTYKNLLKVPTPFSKIPPGKTKEVEITGPGDIHLQMVKLGWIVEAKKEKPVKILKKPKKRKGSRKRVR